MFFLQPWMPSSWSSGISTKQGFPVNLQTFFFFFYLLSFLFYSFISENQTDFHTDMGGKLFGAINRSLRQ